LGVLVGRGVDEGVLVGVPEPTGMGSVGEAPGVDGVPDGVGDTRIAVKYAACGIVHEGMPGFENDI